MKPAGPAARVNPAEPSPRCHGESVCAQIYCRIPVLGGDMLLRMSDTDLSLLACYVREQSEDAFAEIVRRYLDLVYSAALRQVRSSHLAEEVAQSVFADLSRNAGKLINAAAGTPVLAAWLYTVTRRTAIDAIRKESRRQFREQIAVETNNMNATANSGTGVPPVWADIEACLDDAMAALDEADRSAVLLRYFENKNLREVGEALGTNDDAAQKRVSRAVERLREFFAKRGVTVGATGLVVLISTNAVQSAPVGLALTIANASLAAPGTTFTIMKIATATKLKLAFGAIVVAGAVTALVVQQQNQTKLRGENVSFRQQIARLQAKNAGLSNRIAQIGEAKKLSDEQFNELLKLRGEVSVLHRQFDELNEKNRALLNANTAMLGSNTNPPAPQIHIKARFLTVPKDVLSGLSDATSFNGILTSENASNVLRQLRSRDGVETLAEPEVVLTSGRQVQMRATQTISIVTNFCLQEINGASSIVPQTENVETGPVLNAMPSVLPDGYTIELPVIASVVEFLGYAQSTNTTPAYNSAGQEIDMPTVSPQFRVQSTTNSVNLFDDQTMVFGLKDNQVQTDAAPAELDGSKSNFLNRQTLVFVTATIIDAAGNRVHENISYTNIPPQSAEQ
jgi:RNA polymerase sigma factor (sigma-70 family)